MHRCDSVSSARQTLSRPHIPWRPRLRRANNLPSLFARSNIRLSFSRLFFPRLYVCKNVRVLRYRSLRSEVWHRTHVNAYGARREGDGGSLSVGPPGRQAGSPGGRRVRMPPSIRGVTLSPKRRRFVLLLLLLLFSSFFAAAAAAADSNPLPYPAALKIATRSVRSTVAAVGGVFALAPFCLAAAGGIWTLESVLLRTSSV